MSAPEWPRTHDDRRRERCRRLRRRQLRRRRALALVGLALVFLAIGAAVALARGRGGTDDAAVAGAAVATSQKPPASPSARRSAGNDARPRTSTSPTARQPVMVSGPRSMPVPIITFHHIETPPDPTSNDKYFYDDPAVFARQIRYFVDEGYTAVTLQQVYDFWHGKGRLPRKPVVITFDDGYRTVYTEAAPVLAKYRWPAVLNLISDWIGPNSDQLSTAMVKTLVGRGWEVASHTVSHPDLAALSGEPLNYQLVASRQKLRELFDVPVNFICYPGGAYDQETIDAARAAGYLGALTTHYALADREKMFELPRVALNRQRVGKALAAVMRFAEKRWRMGY